MTARFVVTGTDTDIGKTIFAAGLCGALGAYYWKPVQSGLEEETDSEKVARLGNIPPARILPESYRLAIPASPHYSAAEEGVQIDPATLNIPDCDGPLIVEGAGGALVPLNDNILYAELFARWQVPCIIVARTILGTINHSLMTIEVMRNRGVPIAGIAFVGDDVLDSQDIICRIGNVRKLGRLPMIDNMTAENLQQAIRQNFDLSDFT